MVRERQYMEKFDPHQWGRTTNHNRILPYNALACSTLWWHYEVLNNYTVRRRLLKPTSGHLSSSTVVIKDCTHTGGLYLVLWSQNSGRKPLVSLLRSTFLVASSYVGGVQCQKPWVAFTSCAHLSCISISFTVVFKEHGHKCRWLWSISITHLIHLIVVVTVFDQLLL